MGTTPLYIHKDHKVASNKYKKCQRPKKSKMREENVSRWKRDNEIYNKNEDRGGLLTEMWMLSLASFR